MNDSVFIDSSFWISYRDPKDVYFHNATRSMSQLLRQRVNFITTMPVVCEIHAQFVRNRRGREQILIDLWQNPLIRRENVLPEDEEKAVDLLRKNADKTYSLCDALSFAVMRRLGIRRAASFDRHFEQFGEFEIVS